MPLILILFLLETNPLKIVLKVPIRVYQETASKAQGSVCNFSPTCSHFMYEAIDHYGILGVIMGADRLQRCHTCTWSYLGKYYHGIRNNRIYDPIENHNPFKHDRRTPDHPLWR